VWGPAGLALDGEGGLLVCEFYGHRVRRVSAGGVVSTLAGSGAAGFANGAGTGGAAFNGPLALTHVSASGIVYIADNYNMRIRSLTLATGAVGTLAGNGANACVDGIGTAASLVSPNAVAADAPGLHVYFVGWGENRLRRVTLATREVVTLAGAGGAGFADGPAAAALFSGSIGVALLPASAGGLVLVADFTNNRIRALSANGLHVSTVAGSGAGAWADGAGAAAALRAPCQLFTDASGQYVWFADQGNHRVRRLAVGGAWAVDTLGGGGGSLIAGSDAAPFNAPYGVAANATAGAVYVGDQNANRVRVLTCGV